MPLFGYKFSPKKTPARKYKNSENLVDNLVLDQRTVELNLGAQKLRFQNGDWTPENGKPGLAHKSNIKLKKQLQDLEEENNLLRIKYEILLNMLTETTAKNQLNEKQLEKFNKKIKK